MRQGMPSPILGSLLLVARARLRFLVSPRYALLENRGRKNIMPSSSVGSASPHEAVDILSPTADIQIGYIIPL